MCIVSGGMRGGGKGTVCHLDRVNNKEHPKTKQCKTYSPFVVGVGSVICLLLYGWAFFTLFHYF